MDPKAPDTPQWIELAAHVRSHMVRNHFVHATDAQGTAQWRDAHGNLDVYASICRFERPDRATPFTCDLVLDIDDTDLEAARAQARGICDCLINRWELDPGWIGIWFSGAKGFHIVLPRVVFGEAEGRQAMTFYRYLARRLASQGFDRIDTSIYQPSRILRLPNSIHSRTSLYKFPLEHAELITLDVHAIRQMARRPRDHGSMATAAHEAPKAVNWWHRVEDWYAGRRNRQTVARDGGIFQGQGWQYPPCVRKAERATPQDGKRHETLLTLARFFALIDMAPAEIAHRLHEINARNPIRDTDYIARVARDARRYRGFKGCPNDTLAALCEPQACFLCQRRTQIVNRRKNPPQPPPPRLSGPQSPDAPSQSQDHRIRGGTAKGLGEAHRDLDPVAPRQPVLPLGHGQPRPTAVPVARPSDPRCPAAPELVSPLLKRDPACSP